MRRFTTLAALVIVACAGMAVGRTPYDKRARRHQASNLQENQDRYPIVRTEPIGRHDLGIPDCISSISRPKARRSIGLASTSTGLTGPGFAVDNSTFDYVYWGKGHQVDFRVTPSIHFSYTDSPGAVGSERYGYNVYDPTGGGNWPRGAGVGCEVQPSDVRAGATMMDVDPTGLVVLVGLEVTSGSLDNRFYFQPQEHSCYWGTSSAIPPSQYNAGFFDPTSRLHGPKIQIQEWAGDTVLHLLAVESECYYTTQNLRETVVSYFRKVGSGASGTWEGPVVIDTAAYCWGGSISASRVSPKVAVSYTHYHEMAYVHDNVLDMEVFMRQSDSLGLAWAPPTNITNYPRTGDQSSYAGFWETYAYFDSEDGLHIIWNGFPIVADPYNNPSANWNDLSCSIFHWTDRVAGPSAGGTITRIHNAEWGEDYLSLACGSGESGSGWLGFFSISECNEHLYTIFNQYLDAWGNWGDPQVDDCADANYGRRANGEIGLCISSSLDGLLWDAARNLTDTYTPNCSTISTGGVCMSELKPTMSRYGMDSSAFGVELSWPEEELVDPSGGNYGGSNYLHIFYTEDHFPGWGWWNPDRGPITNNPLKWIRLACVDPIPSSQIMAVPTYIGYPEYTQHNVTDTVTIAVQNDGNSSLNVARIAAVEEPGPYAGWLGLSDTALAVPAGADNIATFSMYLNEEQQVNAPGTVVLLRGEVYLLSDADNNDSLSILIDCLVADTVVGGEWDTLATSMSARSIHPGDHTRLVVNNLGEMGSNGPGAVNLDFSTDGSECDPEATVYLYSGGPVVIRRDIESSDTSYVINYAMYQDDFSTELSFKPVATGTSSGEFSGSNYDGYRTGTIVNRDSTIALEREYFAPTGGGDSTDFIVMRTRFYSIGGSPHQGLTLAEVIDWDIPSDIIADNTAAVLQDYNVVYLQGTDGGSPGCQENTNRFGAMMLLGYQTNHDSEIDSCWSTCTPYGSFAGIFHQWWDTASAGTVWDSLEANEGLYAAELVDDHAVFTTYLFDYDLDLTDTLTVYSVVTSVRDGDTTDLKANLDAAYEWYRSTLRPGCTDPCGCCLGLTGNVDNDPGDIIDIGDLTKLIDYLFISYTPPACIEEANVDGEGSVDIGDLTKLIDFLFISYTPPSVCNGT